MALAVVWIICLQLIAGQTKFMDIYQQTIIKKFRTFHVDFPRLSYPKGFHGYCNGFMAYVRGRLQDWNCPGIHYVVHAPWEEIRKACKHSENFCENYNEYCMITQDSFPVTICTIDTDLPPSSCSYITSLTNQRLYLLCSRRYAGDPIGILGMYEGS